MIGEKKQELIDFFKYLDINFFDNYKKILDRIAKTVPLEYDENDIIGEMNLNQGIDPNLIIKECCEFYDSIDPLYGEMARNILRDPSLIKFKCAANPKNVLESNQTKVYFSQNWYDFCSLSHELAHGFVTPVSIEDRENQLNLFNGLFTEVPSIVIEYLAKDYLLERKGLDLNALDKQRIANIVLMQNNFFDENGYVGEWQSVIDCIKEKSDITSSMEEALNDDFKFVLLQLLSFFVYGIGILVADYIYLKIKENPQNIRMIDGIFSVISKGNAYPKKCIQLLEEMGIPIVNNGKISLSDENIEILCYSYFNKFGKFYEETKTPKM